LLTGMTTISLHIQLPLTSQLHGSFSQREQLFFLLWMKIHINLTKLHFDFSNRISDENVRINLHPHSLD
jgi:hypothetical protein